MSQARTSRIALVVPNLCVGGAERQIIEIARKMPPERLDVHIVALDDYIPLVEGVTGLSGRLHIVGRHTPPDVTLVFRLARLLRELEIDLAHAFLFLAEVATRLAAPMAGVKAVLGSERNTDYRLETYRWLCLRATTGLQDLVVANSSAGARFNHDLFKVPMERYRIVRNGVDVERFAPADRAACRAALGIEQDALVVGMFASFKRQKNHLLLFRAAGRLKERYPDLRLLLAGDSLYGDRGVTDAYKREMLDAMESLGLADITINLGNRNDVERLYPACDFTVLPSHFEGTPNVVLESMACGVASIVTDVSDNREIVEHGHDGFIVAADDVDDLTEHMEKLCADPALRATLGKNARQSAVKHLSTEVMCDHMASVYEEVLARC